MARDIKEKLYEIDSKKIELDFLQQQFLVECKRFAAQNIDRIVRQAISSSPDQAIALGKKGLAPIKEKVTDLIETISDQVDTIINTKELWLHQQENLDSKKFVTDQYRVYGSKGPAIIEVAIKKLLAPTGDLLLANKLDSDKNWDIVDSQAYYRPTLSWGKEMSQCIEQYNERFNELSKLIKEYEVIAEHSMGNDALDLWDSI